MTASKEVIKTEPKAGEVREHPRDRDQHRRRPEPDRADSTGS